MKDGHGQVSLDLVVDMHDGLLYRVVNRIIERLADSMVDKFVDRAQQIYGLGEI